MWVLKDDEYFCGQDMIPEICITQKPKLKQTS